MGHQEIKEYQEWRSGLDISSVELESVLMEGYTASKVLQAIKFQITTIQDPSERLAAIEEEASKWVR